MTREARLGRAMRAAGVCLALLGGCGDGADDPGGARCVGAQHAALYYGSPEPARLAIDRVQRASIGMVAPDPPEAVCTGMVVVGGWVLTAAHCEVAPVMTFRPSAPASEPIPVVATAVHPRLDLMLLELERTAASAQLVPVPLWDAPIDASWIGRDVTLAGVGTTETGSYGELRFVDEPVVAVDDDDLTVDGMGRSGACSGDSGGPVLVAAPDGTPRVAGVLDHGSRDCLGIDVYLRADRIHAWVAEVTAVSCVPE